MRRALVTLAFVCLSFLAADALACSRCSTMPDNCDVCYEAPGDGGISCYLSQGEYCTVVGPGECEGIGDDNCDGVHCPHDKWTAREPLAPERAWQLVSYEIIRPGSTSRRART